MMRNPILPFFSTPATVEMSGRRSLLAGVLLFYTAIYCLMIGETAAQGTFVARQGASFSSSGDSWVQEFELSGGTQQFAFYFASDYQATAAIFSPSQLASFQNGGAFTAHSLFDRQIGVEFPSLSPGTYYIGVRNATNGTNSYSVEFDELDGYPPETGATLAGSVVTETVDVGKNGGRAWVGFTLESGFLHSVDGVNSGLETYLIPASELTNFRSGGVFQYYESFSGTSTNLPGYSKLTLPPGSYYYAFHNPDSDNKSTVLSVLKWNASGGGGGGGGSSQLELDGPASWQVSGTQITMAAAAAANRGNGTSGSLRLDVWFTTAPYTSGTLSGYRVGSYQFSSTLAANTQFSNVSQTVVFSSPPDGTYYSVMTLSEWDGSEFIIRDFESFPGTSQVGGGGGGGGGGPNVPILNSLQVENGAATTTSRIVVLNHTTSGGTPSGYIASENQSFSGATWMAYTSTPVFVLSNTNGNKTVYFKVRNSAGESLPHSDSIELRNMTPTGVTATDGSHTEQVIVNWNQVPSANYYRVYRHTSNDLASAVPISPWQAPTSYSDTSAQAEVIYYYWVRAALDNVGGGSGLLGGGDRGSVAAAETGYASWIAQFGLSVSNASPGADPNRDRINNLLSYALAIHPINGLSQNEPSPLPTPTSVNPDGQTTYRFLIPAAPAADIRFVIEQTRDFKEWNRVSETSYGTTAWSGSSLPVTNPTADSFGRLRTTFTLPRPTPTKSNCYTRLRVELRP